MIIKQQKMIVMKRKVENRMYEMSNKKYNTIGFVVAGLHLFVMLNLALDLTLIPGVNV